MKKPNFFIVGAPKSGTTSLTKYLSTHPDVFLSTPKEPHHFGQDLYSFHSEEFKDENKYINLFKKAKNKKIIGEASVWYLYSKTAAKEIFEFNPKSKIVIMLRNPITAIPSIHNQNIYNQVENEADLIKALTRNYKKITNQKINPTKERLLLYTEIVNYANQIERYYKYFGKQNVHIIIFDNFVKNTEKEYKNIIIFLGIRYLSTNFKIYNKRKTYRNLLFHKIITNPHNPGRFLPMMVRKNLGQLLLKINTKTLTKNSQNIDFSKSPQLRRLIFDNVRLLEKQLGYKLKDWRNSLR